MDPSSILFGVYVVGAVAAFVCGCLYALYSGTDTSDPSGALFVVTMSACCAAFSWITVVVVISAIALMSARKRLDRMTDR